MTIAQNVSKLRRLVLRCSIVLLATGLTGNALAQPYDVVLANGRVMDPESGLDAVRNVGIKDGKIVAIAQQKLSGRQEVDASGLVVTPGFVDLHAHGLGEFESTLQAQDGVTTHLNLEGGVYPVDQFYRSLEGKSPINYGASVGHLKVRGVTFAGMSDEDAAAPEKFERAFWDEGRGMHERPTPGNLDAMQKLVQRGLNDGALGVGYILGHTPGASREEVLRIFEVTAKNGVANFVHGRSKALSEPDAPVSMLQEFIADAAIAKARVHFVHIGSSGGNDAPLLMEMIDKAKRNGLNITTEVYPYTAGSTLIGSPMFSEDKDQHIKYDEIELPATGERLTKESFDRLRRENPRAPVIIHAMREENVAKAIAHPGVVIASDGVPYADGKGHPRGAGTYARVLGRYVREGKLLGLMEALAKMSYLPAKILEDWVPQMRAKGRIKAGADADIVIFDPKTVVDRATFQQPALPSAGIPYVLVNGVMIVKNGAFQKGVYPGRAVRR
jgi:dihydroorotase